MRKTRSEIIEEINTDIPKLDTLSLNFWKLIKIEPVLWKLATDKTFSDDYWVIAIFGNRCIYFNHFENGFNISKFKKYGLIEDYICNDYSLENVIMHLVAYQLIEKLY